MAEAPGRWDRRRIEQRAYEYGPLATVLVALALALLIFPSALILPDPDTPETLEYAPVPPENAEPPPPDGNLSKLGLAASPGVQGDAPGGAARGPGPGPGVPASAGPLGMGTNPSNKRCVGNPPRQTEDPLSPPCVAFFQGDNFGATYRGVTREEVRILVYLNGGIYHPSSSDPSPSPTNAYFDLFEAPGPEDPVLVRGLRGWQRYFNDRFQTYGRAVHFYVYFDNGPEASSPEARRASAADNWSAVKPFAVVTDIAFGGNEVAYVEEMARRGVLNFGTLSSRPADFFRKFPKLIWGYDPTTEYQSELLSTFVCQKLVGKPVALSGNPEPDLANGAPRRFGLLHTTDDGHPDLVRLARLARQQVEACGGQVVAEATYPECCLNLSSQSDPAAASSNMAAFRRARVTTILWPGGMEGTHGKAAAQMGYLPEWVLLGTGGLDGTDGNRVAGNGPAFDDRAVVVTPQVLQPALPQQLCYQAFREADMEMARNDVAFACLFYRRLFQLFVGIQVAGPRLGPTSVDQGFHAIPHVESKNPQTPACFYFPGDYTCVKDAQFEIWDDQGRPPGDSRLGCWRVFRGGARYFPGRWPRGNLDSDLPHVGDCNGHGAGLA